MCSLSASPVPSPRKNRPSNNSDVVAAACAITAGWIRTIGHVTPMPTGDALGACGDAPEHAPHEGAVALCAHPRVVVVRDRGEVEARLPLLALRARRGRAARAPRSTGCSRSRSRLALLASAAALPPLRPAALCCAVVPPCFGAAALPRLLAAVLRRVGRVRDLRRSRLRHALLLQRLVLLLVLDVRTLRRHDAAGYPRIRTGKRAGLAPATRGYRSVRAADHDRALGAHRGGRVDRRASPHDPGPHARRLRAQGEGHCRERPLQRADRASRCRARDTDGDAFGPYVSVMLSESEDAAAKAQGSFDRIQPPTTGPTPPATGSGACWTVRTTGCPGSASPPGAARSVDSRRQAEALRPVSQAAAGVHRRPRAPE